MTRSDGEAVAFGLDGCGQCHIPALPVGMPTAQNGHLNVVQYLVGEGGDNGVFEGKGKKESAVSCTSGMGRNGRDDDEQ